MSLTSRAAGRYLSLVLALGVVGASRPAHAIGFSAEDSKVFLLTSTYGVMAGTLTGLASLAFYEDPGEKLRNVAMGASIGLYAGILLGAYLVYGVPTGGSSSPGKSGDEEEKAKPSTSPVNPEDPLNLDSGRLMPRSETTIAWQPVLGASPRGLIVGVGLRF